MVISVDELIKKKTPRALELLNEGLQNQERVLDASRLETVDALQPFGSTQAFQEQSALLGLLGDDTQRQAIEDIPISAAQAEDESLQQERLLRQLALGSDIGSGAGLQAVQRLGGAQEFGRVERRLSELEPLADISRRIRSSLSSAQEAGFQRLAQLRLGAGSQRANIRLGVQAPLIQARLQQTDLSGLQGIAEAQQRAQTTSQIAGLAGQFAPQISSFFQPQQPQQTFNDQGLFVDLNPQV